MTLPHPVSRSTLQREDDEMNAGVRVTIEGEDYVVRVGDVSAKLAGELRKNAGYSFFRLQEYLADDPDLDVLAAFVWLARRVRGEDVKFGDVALSYAQIAADGFDIDYASAPEDEDPEAPGGRS